MKRIDADQLEPQMIVHDECDDTTFMVTDVSIGEHSVSVHGRKIVPNLFITGSAALVDHATMYIRGDSGLYDLSSD